MSVLKNRIPSVAHTKLSISVFAHLITHSLFGANFGAMNFSSRASKTFSKQNLERNDPNVELVVELSLLIDEPIKHGIWSVEVDTKITSEECRFGE